MIVSGFHLFCLSGISWNMMNKSVAVDNPMSTKMMHVDARQINERTPQMREAK